MRVLGLPSDIGDPRNPQITQGQQFPLGACGSYRVRWPLEALERAGLAEVQWGAFSLTYVYELAREFDVVVMQRQTDPFNRNFVRHCRKLLGVKVVFDFDDDLLRLDPSNPAYVFWGTDKDKMWAIYQTLLLKGQVDPRIAYEMTPEKVWMVANDRRAGFKSILNEVDLITVTTPHLKRRYERYANTPVVVLPNCINAEDWDGIEPLCPEGAEDYLRIGWAGGESHQQDVALIAGGLTHILEQHDHVALVLVGWEGAKSLFPERVHDRIFTVPWMGIDEYRGYVAGFHLGLAPAVDTPTNRGKSGIRVYELALAGATVVASQWPYGDDVHEGLGLVARTAKEFASKVEWCLDNWEDGRTMGKKLKDHVLAEHTYAAKVYEWLRAYQG